MNYIETTSEENGRKIKLAYFDYGIGDPVLLIHGWPMSKQMWEYQVEPLVNAGYRVIAYDRRGFGESDKPWEGYDYDSLTDDLHAVIKHLKLSNLTLVGFSMGGGEVARYFGKHNGEGVSKVILIASVVPQLLQSKTNPNGITPDVVNDMVRQMNDDRPHFLEAFGKTFFGVNFISHPVSNASLEYYRTLTANATHRSTLQCLDSFAYTDFIEDAKKINVPTLIIHGDNDKTVPIEISSERAVKLIPNSQLLVYKGAPHGLFFTEKARLNRDLVSYITSGTFSTDDLPPDGYAILPSNEPLITR